MKNVKEYLLNGVTLIRKHKAAFTLFGLVLGVGIGGTFEKCALLAKRALLRPIDKRNPKKHIAKLERELMRDLNLLGIGPMGLGGRTTVLGVNILDSHTHIAAMPVAVNVSCHATRSAEKTL